MNPYYYLYYRIYSFLKKTKNHDSALTASLSLSLLVVINLFKSFVNMFSAIIENFEEEFIFLVLITLVLVMISNHYIFVHNKKYIKIQHTYSDESLLNKRIRGVIISIYIAFTILSFFYL